MSPTFEVQLRVGDSVKNASRFGYGDKIAVLVRSTFTRGRIEFKPLSPTLALQGRTSTTTLLTGVRTSPWPP
jgi:hypothetical protein